MSEKLKPCPFCGSENVSKALLPGHTWVTGCNDCGCRTGEYFRSSESVSVWNNRPDPEKVCRCGHCERDAEDEVRSVAEIIHKMAEQGNMPTLCEETPF